jgi:transcriptional regulator with XRE-family HTH domain
MRTARALLGLDQRNLAQLSGLSLPSIQRTESSPGSVRAVVDSLERVLAAFVADGTPSTGLGFGVRLIERGERRVTAHVA